MAIRIVCHATAAVIAFIVHADGVQVKNGQANTSPVAAMVAKSSNAPQEKKDPMEIFIGDGTSLIQISHKKKSKKLLRPIKTEWFSHEGETTSDNRSIYTLHVPIERDFASAIPKERNFVWLCETNNLNNFSSVPMRLEKWLAVAAEISNQSGETSFFCGGQRDGPFHDVKQSKIDKLTTAHNNLKWAYFSQGWVQSTRLCYDTTQRRRSLLKRWFHAYLGVVCDGFASEDALTRHKRRLDILNTAIGKHDKDVVHHRLDYD